MYKESVITPHHAGFGMWDGGRPEGDEWADVLEWQQACDTPYGIWELSDELFADPRTPDEIEDIRGHVYNGPDRIFAICHRDGAGPLRVTYHGLTECD